MLAANNSIDGRGSKPSTPALPPPDERFHPAADFYSYINNKWQKHIHLPPYSGSYGVSEEIESEVREALLKLVANLRTNVPSHPISLLATSFLHTASQRNSVIDLQRVLNTFDCISSKEDVGHSIGALNKIQAQAPLSLVVSSDSYNNAQCNIYLYEPSLGLPEKTYYHTGSRNHIILKYSKMLARIGKLMNIEMLESAVPIEASIIPYLSANDELSDISLYYNPFTFVQLEKKFTHIPWKNILEGWGVESHVYTNVRFIVTSPKYILGLDRMFKEFSLETWRIWMRAQTVLSFVEYLPPPFDDMYFELYEKALKGVPEKLPQKYLTLKVLQKFTPHDLGKLFVEKIVPNGTKRNASALVARLKEATIARLEMLGWMEPETREAAIEKVRAMKFQVAFPDVWESETASVKIDPSRPLLNILNLSEVSTRENINNLKNKDCEKRADKWDDDTFEVNAYYYAEGNMMVIPAGMLRSPFFDLEKSDAWNLGGIGAVIGHEITHGFDDDGRLYDKHGNYHNWWKDKNAKIYSKLSRSVIDLFDGLSYMGGKVDGVNTLSENLADLGGLAIALEALKMELRPEERKAAYKDFFTSYGVSWRNKERPKKAKQSLLLDTHAPAPLRVNMIVRQFDEFYEAFDILPTDAGYIPPELRIRLW